MRLTPTADPQGSLVSLPHGLTPYSFGAALHRGLGTGKPHMHSSRHLVVACHPVRAVNRNRQTTPFTKAVQGLGFGDLKLVCSFIEWLGRDLDGQLGQRTEYAEGTRKQTRDIIAGHVLHDLAAETEHDAGRV